MKSIQGRKNKFIRIIRATGYRGIEEKLNKIILINNLIVDKIEIQKEDKIYLGIITYERNKPI